MTIFRSLCNFIITSLLVSPARSALYTSPDQLTRLTYDYVIVGGGTGGNVVAARLSENPNHQVLVLEAGVSDEGILGVESPLLAPTLSPFTLYDWNYTTIPQTGLGGRSVPYAQGRILGGSSSINLNAYTRGSADDFNRYATVSGDPGWSWDALQPYILKGETFVPPADGHDPTGQYNPAAHGTSGPLLVTTPNEPTPLDQRVLDTLDELSDEFQYNSDMNDGNVLGMGWVHSTTGGGRRISSAVAYIHPNIDRPNLHVLVNAHATKLLQTGTRIGRPLFNRVQFQPSSSAQPTTVQATREVILAAGAFGSPKILQLSGIGDRNELEPLGIQTIVDLPDVGKNLSDHLLLSSAYETQGPSFDSYYREPSTFRADLEEWLTSRTGTYSNTVTNQLGWFRLPDDHPIFNAVPDPAAGPESSHYEMIFMNLFFVPGVPLPETGTHMSVVTALISPTSRGYSRIASQDPFEQPLINPNTLDTEFDRVASRESMKAVQRFISASPWQDFIIRPFGDLANAIDDASIDEYIRNTADTIHHAVGTASMSPYNANWGVVDPNLKVKGVEGVRVVDASVMPFVPNGHTLAPVYIIAERAADIIKASV
ncbi:hypothetical protein AX16_000086 [Volvariella volvacea WC 439]|nr:hypothetical protein AX16_000086 [Volvariella volvacea WC 439]